MLLMLFTKECLYSSGAGINGVQPFMQQAVSKSIIKNYFHLAARPYFYSEGHFINFGGLVT